MNQQQGTLAVNHETNMVERFAKVNGKETKISRTPSLPASSAHMTEAQPLNEAMSAEYRSLALVVIAIYLAQERTKQKTKSIRIPN